MGSIADEVHWMLANLDHDITMVIDRPNAPEGKTTQVRVPHDDIGLGPAEYINEMIGPWSGIRSQEEAMRFVYTRPDGKTSQREVTAIYSEDDRPLLFRFEDGSVFDPAQPLMAPDRRDARDEGVRLLEPITDQELAGIENILAVLWRAADDGTLSEVQQHQIIALAEVIRTAQTEAQPGSTNRWTVIGVVRGAVRYLRKDLIRDVAVLEEIAEQAQRIGWQQLASEIANNLPL